MAQRALPITHTRHLRSFVFLITFGYPMFAQRTASVTIENKSSWDITNVYIEKADSASWGADVLRSGILSSGMSFLYTNIEAGLYDVKIVDEDGDACVLHNVALSQKKVWRIDNAELRSCQFKGAVPDPEGVPRFPWPPPVASGRKAIDTAMMAALSPLRTLGDASHALSMALEKNGYNETSYWAVPGEFALATKLEQIDSAGKPKSGADRWSASSPHMPVFSLSSYLKALFTSTPGYYRVIVFIVTPTPFTSGQVQVSEEEANHWLSSGLNVLPPPIAARAYTNNTVCTALIYEFKRDSNATPTLLQPGPVDAQTHLVNAGIWNSFAGSAPKR